MWHYFISHASEDNLLIAKPLAHVLQEASFKVWYDDFSLKLGDPLLQSVDKGLQQSRYGIVILSPAFFSKQWTQRELAGLLAKEGDGKKVILPVWHNVTSKDVAKRSPILADRKGVETSLGLQSVAEQIVQATYPNRVNKLPLTNIEDNANIKSVKKTFSELLDGAPTTQDIRIFISAYHSLLAKIVGYAPFLVPSYKLSPTVPFDFALVEPEGLTGPIGVQFVVLGPVSHTNPFEQSVAVKRLLSQIDNTLGPKLNFNERPANDYLGSPYVGEYVPITEAMQKLITLKKDNNIHWRRPEVWNFKFLIITGRRNLETADERDKLIKFASYKVGIASYDRLLDN
jgi:TIR domain